MVSKTHKTHTHRQQHTALHNINTTEPETNRQPEVESSTELS